MAAMLLFLAGPGVAAFAAPGDAATEPPRRLAGVLSADPDLLSSWGYCGTWMLPVGDPHELGGASDDLPGYAINRGVERRRGSITHQGADLCNRRPGGPVRAAANGIVAFASVTAGSGYGHCAVIAHRDVDGDVYFSVYAHLAAGSLRVRAGDRVQAGERLGRVGRTGRATTDHLHFEIRSARDPWERWETSEVVDPIEFVARTGAGDLADDADFGRFHRWALSAALVDPGERGNEPLTRLRWWRMLAVAARLEAPHLPAELGPLRTTLESAGVLAEDGPRHDGRVGSDEIEDDLARLAGIGLRLPPWIPEGASAEAAGMDSSPAPATRGDRVTLAHACAALAHRSVPIAAEAEH